MRALLAVCAGLCSAAAALTAPQAGSAWTFDADRAGSPPAGFTLAAMRQDGSGAWSVRRDGANGVLVHDANPAHAGLAMAIAEAPAFRDGTVSVRLRLAGGERAGGVIWRYQDAENFHAAVLDLSRRSLALFRIVHGNRVRVEDEDDLELDAAAWHTLKVVHDQAFVRVSLGGIRVFDERDRTFGAGRVGLLASGASLVWFDDFQARPETRQRQ
jgi:hypothetical protein